jgi:flagellar protein FliS
MTQGRFVQEYQKNAVVGASPLQLVIMLYDGALRAMELGKQAMSHKDLERQNSSIQKAQKIVLELTACLDLTLGGDVAKNLFALYTYVVEQLVEANVQDKPEPIDRAIKVISDLRESWVELERRVSTGEVVVPTKPTAAAA